MWDVRCAMWDVFSLIRVRTQVEDDYIRGERRSRLPVIQAALTAYVSDLEVLDLSGVYGSRVRCLDGASDSEQPAGPRRQPRREGTDPGPSRGHAQKNAPHPPDNENNGEVPTFAEHKSPFEGF